MIDDFLYCHEQSQVPRLARSITLARGHEQILRADGTIEDLYYEPMRLVQEIMQPAIDEAFSQCSRVLHTFLGGSK
jgi:hypothetical protein